ncbi:hypothetical protein NFI96_009717, partial [Prochilodus magdalenae]
MTLALFFRQSLEVSQTISIGPQQRLDLGWVIIGDVCLGSPHRPVDVTSFHTSVLENGRTTFLTPFPNHMYIKEQFGTQNQSDSSNFSPLPVTPIFNERNLGKTIFEKTKDDDKIGLSTEDKMFLELMDKEMYIDDANNWVAPLPFRIPRPRLPNNRKYAHHRLQSERRSSKPEQWHYICTTQNPPDYATRSVPAAQLTSTTWLTGPHFLSIAAGQSITEKETYNLTEPNLDPEVHSHATTLTVPSSTLGSYRFERFSSWKSLVQAIAFLKHVVKSKITVKKDKTLWLACMHTTLHSRRTLRSRGSYYQVCTARDPQRRVKLHFCISARKDIPKGSSLRKLNSCVDEDGLLRIGGRLKHGRLEAREKYPLVIPGQSHIATLLVRHFHDKVRHQGRAFTEGAVRTAGFWIVGAKNCIKRILHSCVTCLNHGTTFTYVGLDVFGPWTVITRRTRGGQANNK